VYHHCHIPKIVRLYDVNTVQCFVSANARDQHSREITSVSQFYIIAYTSLSPLPKQVHYTPDARMYCSSGDDGAIKVRKLYVHMCM